MAVSNTYLASLAGDGVLTDRLGLRHDLQAPVLVVLEDVAVHLAGYAVLVVAHLVPTEAHAGTLAAHDLVVADDRRARAAVNACTTTKKRQNETGIAQFVFEIHACTTTKRRHNETRIGQKKLLIA